MEGEDQRVEIEFQELMSTLPKEKSWDGKYLHLYQNSWYHTIVLKDLLSFRNNFKPRQNDIILTSNPKSGSTWLKAIVFLIKTRTLCPLSESPLLTSSPHDLIPMIDFELSLKDPTLSTLESMPDPRVFDTHFPYHSLPKSVTNGESGCKIVYICTNPLDQFISSWHFHQKLAVPGSDLVPLEEAFEMHCNRVHSFGPFWDHMLEYWKASQENPHRVLFLKYEDLKKDSVSCTRRVAEFLGYPFSVEEEEKGVIEEICRICSFENLKNLEVNKNGRRAGGAKNDHFFRKGEVGDWVNHMGQRLDELIQEKLDGSGLTFNLSASSVTKE